MKNHQQNEKNGTTGFKVYLSITRCALISRR